MRLLRVKIKVSLRMLVMWVSSLRSRVRFSKRVCAVVDAFFHRCCVVKLNGPNLYLNLNWCKILVIASIVLGSH